MDPAIPEMDVVEQEVTKFAGVKPERVFTTTLAEDPYLELPTHTTSNIESFLSRPLLIKTYTWTYGGAFSQNFDPWEDFLTNASISPKLNNYQLLKGNLHVKFMINGMPFHMGRMLVSYWPLDATTRGSLDTALTGDPLLIRLSQLPCYSELNPSTNSACEITCPFVHYQTHVNVPSYPSSFEERIGRVFMQSFAVLDTCNGNTVNANIAVYAWMTDVKLIVPTAANMAVNEWGSDVESDSEEAVGPGSMAPTNDKTKTIKKKKPKPKPKVTSPEDKPDGVISSISSTAAATLGKLSQVPLIGPYAKAGEMVAGGIGSVAKMFGFSRPTVKTDISYYRNRPFGLLASTSGADTSIPLSLDPNHGVTIDPSVAGVSSSDEMTLKHISRKWSYVTQLNWTSADTSGTTLYEVAVYPGLRQGTGSVISMTSIDFASYPFRFWRGDMEYRIVVVSSKMQTGRLRIAYEPYGQATSSTNTNITYNTVLDISQSNEATVCVPWSQAYGYKRLGLARNVSAFGASGVVYATSSFNGVMYLSVLNPLVSPSSGINARILIFARGGENMSFAAPRGMDILTSYAQMDSVDVFAEEEGCDTLVRFGDSKSDDNPIKTTIWHGEETVSIRAMLKRYSFYRRDLFNVTGVGESAAEGVLSFGVFPSPAGTPPALTDPCFDLDSAANETNYNGQTYLNYFVCGFIGWRGSLRYKCNVTGVRSKIGSFLAVRDNNLSIGSSNVNVPLLKSDISYATFQQQPNVITAGADVTSGEVMPSLEVEMPYYSNYRFIPFNPDLYANVGLRSLRLATRVLFTVDPTSISAVSKAGVIQDSFVAAGDDFSLIWYIGPCALDLASFPAP
jgi:hypothetical protein